MERFRSSSGARAYCGRADYDHDRINDDDSAANDHDFVTGIDFHHETTPWEAGDTRNR